MAVADANSDTSRSDTSKDPSYTSSPNSLPFQCSISHEGSGESWDVICPQNTSLSSLSAADSEVSRGPLFKASTFGCDWEREGFAYGKASIRATLGRNWSKKRRIRSPRKGRPSPINCSPDSRQESQLSLASNFGIQHDSFEAYSLEALSQERPYTSSLGTLGIPNQFDGGHPPELSIISDAGDQQQLRLFASSSGNNRKGSTSEEQNDVCPENDAQYELQSDIFAALVHTRNSDTRDPGFLPKAQLYQLVNRESVARELSKHQKLFHIPKKIHEYADAVCREEEVTHAGKKKIKTFRKIFALLVLAETASSISLFLETDVSDLDLPLASLKHRGTTKLRRRDPSGQPSQEPLECFQHPVWSPAKLLLFENWQWIMLAPFFSQDMDGDVKHYVLRDQHILPFVASQEADDDDAEYHGGFGKVFMVRIHNDHHNFRDKTLCKRGFAVKQLYRNDRDSFKKEVTILKMFSGGRSHKHVVSLLATYEQFNKYHFIFYRAEGDLFKYWKKLKCRPELSYSNTLWVAEQFCGIADGLLKLHKHLTFTIRHRDTEEELARRPTGERQVGFVVQRPYKERTDSIQSNGVREQPPSPVHVLGSSYGAGERRAKRLDQPQHGGETVRVQVEQYGRHGDINPGNILWYDDSDKGEGEEPEKLLKGTLKISDFGQAELNSLQSRTRQRSVANTMTYRPPECDFQPRTIRQSYDIWCLGCVYLEFITWALGGAQLLQKFVRKRRTPDIFLNNQETDTFFQVVEAADSDRPGVMVKEQVTQFIEDLHRHPNCTEYFHEILNLIQQDMLVADSRDRKPCEKVRKELADMHKRCLTEKEYAIRTNPWSSSPLKPVSQAVEIEVTEDAEQVINKINKNLHLLSGRSGKRSKAKGE